MLDDRKARRTNYLRPPVEKLSMASVIFLKMGRGLCSEACDVAQAGEFIQEARPATPEAGVLSNSGVRVDAKYKMLNPQCSMKRH